MDVILLGASTIISSSCVSQYVSSNKNSFTNSSGSSPATIALLLGLGLFSLSVLETTPSSWLLILRNDSISQNENMNLDAMSSHGIGLSIRTAYFILLTLMSLFVLVIWPSAVGVHVFENLKKGRVLADYCNWFYIPNDKRWWWIALRYVVRMSMVLLQWTKSFLLHYFCLFPWGSIRSRSKSSLGSSGDNADGDTLLALTMKGLGANNKPQNSLLSPFNTTRLGRITTGSLFVVVTTLLFFSSIGPRVIHTTGDAHHNVLSIAVSWLCALGILISSILNGFGSVSLPYTSLAGLYLEPIKVDTVAKAEAELIKTQESLQFRRSQLTGDATLLITPKNILPRNNRIVTGSRRAAIGRSNSDDDSSSKSVVGGWLKGGSTVSSGNHTPSFSEQIDEITQQKRAIHDEIGFLQILIQEMEEDIEEMKHAQALAIFARTPLGKIRSWIGAIFSVVLLIRLCCAAKTIWFTKEDNGSRTDPITTALVWFMGHSRYVKTQEEYNTLAQFVSLLITAALTLSQVRNFLRTVVIVNRRLALLYQKYSCSPEVSTKSSSTSSTTTSIGGLLYPYFLASLMSCYFLACIVLTKMMLPYQYHSEFSAAFGGGGKIFFKIQSSVVNATFALSAIISAAILAIFFEIQRQNTYRHSRFSELDV